MQAMLLAAEQHDRRQLQKMAEQRQHMSSIQNEHAGLFAAHSKLASAHDSLFSEHQALLQDHRHLTGLHQQLTDIQQATVQELHELKALCGRMGHDQQGLSDQVQELRRMMAQQPVASYQTSVPASAQSITAKVGLAACAIIQPPVTDLCLCCLSWQQLMSRLPAAQCMPATSSPQAGRLHAGHHS